MVLLFNMAGNYNFEIKIKKPSIRNQDKIRTLKKLKIIERKKLR